MNQHAPTGFIDTGPKAGFTPNTDATRGTTKTANDTGDTGDPAIMDGGH